MKRLQNTVGGLERERSWYAKAILNSNPHMIIDGVALSLGKRRKDLLEEGECGVVRVLMRRDSGGRWPSK